MTENPEIFIDIQQPEPEEKGMYRKPYAKPQLVDLGDLRALTLGLSPSGYLDSGGSAFSEFPPTIPPPP